MQALDQMSREELVALVHDLQARLSIAVHAGGVAAGDLDYITLQALTVLDNSGIAALVFDTAGTLSILAANTCLCALVGRARDEVDRLSVTELLAEEDRDRLRRMLRLPRQGGFASAGGWRLSARSGELREIEVSGYDLDFRGRRARFVIVQDVTHRRREQLVHERLAAIVETSRDAILSHTVDGIVLSWNRAAQRLFGYDAAELVGRSVDALLPDDIRDQERALLRGRIAAGLPIENYQTQRQRKDGTRVDVALSVSPLRDVDGRIVGAASIIRDMRATKELDQMLAGLLDSSDDLIASRSLEGTVLTWNRGAERVLGWRAEEIVGCNYLILVPEAQRNEAERISNIAAQGQGISRLDTVRRHKDGHLVQLSVTVAPLRDSRNRVVGLATIGRDVTQQRDGQRALRESEARFRSLVEASAQAVWITNARGEVEGEIPSWQGYTGLTFEQVRGTGWLQAIHPEDRALTAQRWRTGLRQRQHLRDGVPLATARRGMAPHARARGARSQRGRQHSRVGRHEHRRHRAQGCGGRTGAARRGSRFLPGCHHQSRHGRHHFVLEPRRRGDLRLPRGGGDRTRLPPAHPERHAGADAGARAATVPR